MKSFGLGDIVVRWIEAYIYSQVLRVNVGGEHTAAILKHSGIPQGSVICPLLFLLFVNDIPDVIGALTLLFADDVKMATRRSQSMNLYSSLTAAWDLPINPTKCNYLAIGREVPLGLSFFPRWVWHHPVSKLVKDLRVSDR